MEKTFKDKAHDGLLVGLEYLKKNYLSLVVALLTILIYIFLVLPAASVTVSDINLVTNQETYTLISLTQNVETYRLSDILFGRIIQQVTGTFNYVNNSNSELSNPNLVHSFGVVFFPNNVFVGFGLILFLIASILMAFPKLIMRIVGASLALVGAFLMLFIYSQIMYDIPIGIRGLQVEYDVVYGSGPIILIVTGFAIAAVAIFVTVMDYIADFKHRKSESQRYLRGGV
jgi:hypothetical protein